MKWEYKVVYFGLDVSPPKTIDEDEYENRLLSEWFRKSSLYFCSKKEGISRLRHAQRRMSSATSVADETPTCFQPFLDFLLFQLHGYGIGPVRIVGNGGLAAGADIRARPARDRCRRGPLCRLAARK